VRLPPDHRADSKVSEMEENPYERLAWRYRTLRRRRKKWVPLSASRGTRIRRLFTCLALSSTAVVGMAAPRAYGLYRARREWRLAQRASCAAALADHLARMDSRLRALGRTRAALGLTDADVEAVRRRFDAVPLRATGRRSR
jgi:hypothetical protein